MLVFPGADRVSAGVTAQKLRRGWQGETTFSGGVAEFGKDGSTVEELIRSADQALCKAKKSGRNTICLAGEIEHNNDPLTLRVENPVSTKVLVVTGAAPRVGATSFALALAAFLSKDYPVEVIDSGGGASEWLRDSIMPVRTAPPFSISPGVVTIIDANKVSSEILPHTEAIFVVTDLSRNTLNLKPFVDMSKNVYLVGNRGAPYSVLRELSDLWGVRVFCSFDEEPEIRNAQIKQATPLPKKWEKTFRKAKEVFV